MPESTTSEIVQSLLGENGGHVYRAHFADLDDVEGQLTAWVEAAPSNVSDSAARAYAYWRAFDWRAERAAHEPGQLSVSDVGSQQKTEDQREDWRRKRNYWWDEYRRRKSGNDTDSNTAARSQSVPSRVSWA